MKIPIENIFYKVLFLVIVKTAPLFCEMQNYFLGFESKEWLLLFLILYKTNWIVEHNKLCRDEPQATTKLFCLT